MDETVTTSLGTFVQQWACELPEPGAGYRVLEQEWLDDYTVRVIRRIELI